MKTKVIAALGICLVIAGCEDKQRDQCDPKVQACQQNSAHVLVPIMKPGGRAPGYYEPDGSGGFRPAQVPVRANIEPVEPVEPHPVVPVEPHPVVVPVK